jgi:hypothetical protein
MQRRTVLAVRCADRIYSASAGTRASVQIAGQALVPLQGSEKAPATKEKREKNSRCGRLVNAASWRGKGRAGEKVALPCGTRRTP